MSTHNEEGFAHLSLILLSLVVIGLIALSNSQNLASLTKHQNGEVEGIVLAKNGSDDSGGNSGSTNIVSQGGEDSHSSGSDNSRKTEDNHASQPAPTASSQESHSGNSNGGTTSGKRPESRGGADVRVPLQTAHPSVNPSKHPEASESARKHGEIENKVEHKTEVENEVENEVARPEVSKVELHHNGGSLEVNVHEASGESHKVEASGSAITRVKLTTKKGGREIEVQLRGESFRIKVSSQSATTNFPITFDKDTGVLSVQTGNGLKQIRILPDQASDIAKTAGIQQKLGETELVAENDPKTEDELVFKVQGTRQVRLLGLIPVTETLTTEVGAQTGTVVKTDEPWWAKFLSVK